MPSFELISNHLCPYTQRAAILLAEKALPYERTYVDLADKPAWLLRISPLGKVPVLRVGDAAIFETSVICQYIEEVAPETPLLPADPVRRAHHRAWAELASAMLADVYAFYSAPDASRFDEKRADLQAKMRWLDQHLGEGPYFDGAAFGLVDAAFAPVLRLFDTFDEIADFGVFAQLSRVPAYRAALAQRPSVAQVVVPDYARIFRDYLAARGSHLSRQLARAS